MTNKIHRAGAAASAILLFAILMNAEVSLANSENLEESATLRVDQQDTDTIAADDALPRFVATPVVQVMPEIATEDISSDLVDADEQQPAVTAASLHDLVGALGAEQEPSGELKCLAQAVYFESRGEPLAGQLAVAKVVINRSEAKAFPGSYCSVVTQRAQFSFVRNGRIPTPKTRTKAWTRAKAIATIAHKDMWASKADNALYFHAKSVNPSWARRKKAQATIDSHIFYR